MERKIFHGNISPVDIAQSLLAEFNQGNLRAQTLGQSEKMIVQVGTRPDASSGGQTALTITVQKVDDGIMVEIGEQAWLGVAASLGVSAINALRNPFSLLGRLDDIAQDIENLQLNEKIWRVIDQTAKALNASTQLSDRLKRLACGYCHTANEIDAPTCIACGAPLGNMQPITCKNCGYVIVKGEKRCPNCDQPL
ncbi:MAG: zinc ribbon domain-containing protein [Anaerolineales bacterium]